MRYFLYMVYTIAFLLCSGCGLLQPLDSGRDQITTQAHTRLQVDNAHSLPIDCLVDELTLPVAFALALQCNPEIRIILARLDITTATLNRELRIDNPTLALDIRGSDNSNATNIELDLLAPVLDIILFPARQTAAKARLSQAQQLALSAILDLANDLESAWYSWQKTELQAEIGRYYSQTRHLNAELGQRYYDAGNINQLELANLQVAAGHSGLRQDNLNAQRLAARIQIQRLLGIQSLPAMKTGLRKLPNTDPDTSTILNSAEQQHPLFQAGHHQKAAMARSLALERGFRYLLNFNAGLSLEQEADGEFLIGPSIELELPLFNQNQAEIATASAGVEIASEQWRVLNNNFNAEINLTLGQMQLARKRLQRYREALLPAYKSIMQQTQLEYNFMLNSAFQLLNSRAEQFNLLLAFVDDVGLYWQSAAKLRRLSGGTWHPQQTALLTFGLVSSNLDDNFNISKETP